MSAAKTILEKSDDLVAVLDEEIRKSAKGERAAYVLIVTEAGPTAPNLRTCVTLTNIKNKTDVYALICQAKLDAEAVLLAAENKGGFNS